MRIGPFLFLVVLATTISCSRNPNELKKKYIQTGNKYFAAGKYRQAAILSRSAVRKDAKFGLNGSISTEEACEAAGGTFMPHVFGWMVHMYPWEKTPDEIWSVERQIKGKAGSEKQKSSIDKYSIPSSHRAQ